MPKSSFPCATTGPATRSGINWRSWAKAGKPIVKEYQEEYFVRHALLLDTFSPVPGDERFEEAVSLAASFAADVDTSESLLDLLFVGAEAYCFTGGRGLVNADRMLEILACARSCTDRPFSTLAAAAADRARLLSGCTLVLLGWDAQRRGLVTTLAGFGLPLLVLAVVEKGTAGTLDPGPMKGRPHRFAALEPGEIQEGLDSWQRTARRTPADRGAGHGTSR